MTVSFNGEVTAILRDQLGFTGAYVADWNVLEATKVLGYPVESTRSWGLDDALSVADRAEIAIEAGVNHFGGQECYDVIVDLVEEGRVDESLVDESVRKLLRTKFELGLFDNPFVDESIVTSVVGKPRFKEAGGLAQRKSVVLLKNDTIQQEAFLPLKRHHLRVYAENINPEVLKKYAIPVATPEEADVAILRLATPFQSRKGLLDEMFHHGDIDFKEPVKTNILNITTVVPTVIDIYLDRAAVIPEIADASKSLLGTFGVPDEALLDIVFGELAPSGKLPITLPSSIQSVVDQSPDVAYDVSSPVYQFGFGLSY
ncbi:glycoside hydrolase family 3 C-terminal domain-containing protein [Tunicatimonas pelagia]|uniref:glycoside hydrolase family 3 C-terminal domain-containing protein n=1 Tax=Tunicatimonas pelagia TaxID=931531 RepID=UPI002666021B|nr:glycoside hydrolase family 3 C-terminal domain-containing protein [Tunicatimonas pelagia]WKN44971.1 glycoside hydrolase family 3 C-terminal domain-containing protein [Tunicatimonas pelagia]